MSQVDINKLVIIGNGFDLAHGLKTSYKDFINWYMCNAGEVFLTNCSYSDLLIELGSRYQRHMSYPKFSKSEDVINFIKSNDYYSLVYKSAFFKRILESFNEGNWVDIEKFYFQFLRSHFSSNSTVDKKTGVVKLNREFDFLIEKLIEYIKGVNENILEKAKTKLSGDSQTTNFNRVFYVGFKKVKILNFNYTETLNFLRYSNDEDVIHIHGRVTERETNPIIFGYGDEYAPGYQDIEDSGENIYLDHIKSFGYFKTNNYNRLLSYIDSEPFEVYILGHSCGLSDRVLLNGIFEHEYCKRIHIYYHKKSDGSDNFKEITQEISRHFRDKEKMRRKIVDKNNKNIIPQNS